VIPIEIVDGDISLQDTDAIVNAANNHFWMGAGVAGAIKRRGGAQIEADAMRQGPVDPGDVVITRGQQLAAKYVIHAAVMGQDLQTSASIIERATRSSLSMADAHGVTSIAFPAFGTGVGGFPVDECARIMIAAVRAHQPKSLRLVRFVLFGQPAYDAFVRVAALKKPPDDDEGEERS
jgi:O-acetyl-ADP-ribose deacetylase (regulator of RNase III)